MNERSLLQPLFLLVLVLDQLLKGAAVLLLPVDGHLQLLPGFDYVLVQSVAGIASPQRLRLAVIVLLCAWLLLRLQRRSARAQQHVGPALLLLAAGIASNLMDLMLLRQRIGLFALQFPQGELLLSVADGAVAIAALLMVADLARTGRPALPETAHLPRPRSARVDLSSLPRGIDNIRVDVQVSPALRSRVREIAAAVLAPEVWREAWRAVPYGPNPASLDALRAGCRELVEGAVHRARDEGRPVLVSLAQLALVACIRTETTAMFEQLVRELRREVEQHPRPAARTAARQQQHLATLGRRRNELIEQVRELLLQQVQRSETGALRELRRALAGEDAGLDASIVANPMLCAPDPEDAAFLLRRYQLLLGQRAEDSAHPGRVERLLRQCLDCDAEPGLGGEDEVASGVRADPCPWLDDPDNLDRLLDLDATLRQRQGATGRAAAVQLARQAREQGRLLDALETRLRAEGLMPLVLASEPVAALWKGLSLPISPKLLQRYLTDRTQRRVLAARLRRLERGGGSEVELLAPLNQVLQRQQHAERGERRRAVSRFVRAFFVYARDRKRLRAMEAWLSQIHLLDEPESLRLAHANRTVHAFLTGGDSEDVRDLPVAGHVIVKADVRGSTTMTAELLERQLNPATHFSAQFFEPIAALLPLYGASKVFVEGDAVILALLEQPGDVSGCLSVARACGLARGILQIVAQHNVRAARHHLPRLELGIGIAYERGPPTWLYDDDRPIMISPAIGRADRLSSCAAFLRSEPHFAAGNRVQVFQAVTDAAGDDKKGAARFRYNVDGIELEPAAFHRLAGEIRLSLRAAAVGPRGGMERFHSGRYSDARGVLRDLTVREGRIWSFDRRKGPMRETGEAFFEVVVTRTDD